MSNEKLSKEAKPPLRKDIVMCSPLSVRDLRVGNYLMCDGVMVKIDSRSMFDIWEQTKEYQPIPLTEDIMLKFRRDQSPNFQPVEFQKVGPSERQIENNFWSNLVDDDYCFHLSPSYGYDWIKDKAVKSNKIEFWFCWYNSQGQWFLPIKNIRGENRLQYVHQLQNLFYQLSGFDLVLR